MTRPSLPSALKVKLFLLCALLLSACQEKAPSYSLSQEELYDPASCASCHPTQHQEWSGSMHAYASEDPVFVAMNARGQRETNGELGNFCINCHAPMAVQLGLSDDGLNLSELPSYAQGVTCYFCHSVESVEGNHNNPLKLANDGVMRGGLKEPIDNKAHASSYSKLMDRTQPESAKTCGACHDVVTPAGVHLERTFKEWQDSLYANEDGGGLTCGSCHMRGQDAAASNVDNSPLRRVHDHAMPAIDVAITTFPEQDAQKAAVQELLDTTLSAELCVTWANDETQLNLTLENITAGHSFPSGAAHDRRVWVEVAAYQDENLVFSSGLLSENEPLAALEDEQLWRFGDQIYDDDGHEVHMFWDARTIESNLLPAPTTLLPGTPHYTNTHKLHTYRIAGELPDRATIAVKFRALGIDILQDLVDSGDLNPAHLSSFQTMTLASTQIQWTQNQAKFTESDGKQTYYECVSP